MIDDGYDPLPMSFSDGVIDIRDGDWLIIGAHIDSATIKLWQEAVAKLGVDVNVTFTDSDTLGVYVVRAYRPDLSRMGGGGR